MQVDPRIEVIDEAIAAKIGTTEPGHARRLFHGRGHVYPGLEHVVVNWYPPYVQIGLYAEESDTFVEALTERIKHLVPGVEGIFCQHRAGRATRTDVLVGELPDEHVVLEHGLKYVVQPGRNQNVGLFLDMSHVREWLAPCMSGARVLNLFAYTCAFSVSAIHHGAQLVVNNDMSRNSLELGRRNHELNGHDLRNIRMVPHNLFKSWWKLKQYGPYDVIIIDPPTNQRGSFVAEKSYGQVLKRIPDLAARDAIVVTCLNSPFLDYDFLTAQMARWCESCELEHRFSAHEDFPDRYPERGLKVQAFRYRGS